MTHKIKFEILTDSDGDFYITRDGRPVNNDCRGTWGESRTWKNKDRAINWLNSFGWTPEEAEIKIN